MEQVLYALSVIINHFHNNISNYLLFIGLGIVLYYIKISLGFMPFLLAIGILMILTAIVIELNKVSIRKKRSNY